MTRRIPTPIPYDANAPARWLRTLVAAINDAAAALCCHHWKQGLAPRLQPAHIVSTPHADRALGQYYRHFDSSRTPQSVACSR